MRIFITCMTFFGFLTLSHIKTHANDVIIERLDIKNFITATQVSKDNPKYKIIEEKLALAISNVSLFDDGIKKITINIGRKFDSFKEDGEVTIHIEDPLWLWVHLISKNPAREAYLVNIRDGQHKLIYEKLLGSQTYSLLINKCLDVNFKLPSYIYFFSDFHNNLNFNINRNGIYETLNMKSTSCIIENSYITVREYKNGQDGRYKSLMEAKEDFKLNISKNNPPLKNAKLNTSTSRTPIGIIDTGIDYNNPYFQDKLIPSSSSNKLFPYLGLDLVENDSLPFDFYVNSLMMRARTFDFRLQTIHGSHVAGIALKDSPELSLVPVRMIEGENGYELDAGVELFTKAVKYLKTAGVKCVNMSFGDNAEKAKPIMEKIILENPEILFIAAAGNDTKNIDEIPEYPASIKAPNIITVASIDDDNTISSFSNFNKDQVLIGAKGNEVESYWPYGPPVKLSGTSMAAPQVTRVCGKIHNKFPTLTAIQIKEKILSSAKRINSLKEYINEGRILNETAALK